MLSQLIIPKQKSGEPALNQETFYAIGLGHVQRLASRIWTDYNVHDPGITTLELLCYALTDLSYRATLPVKDLLASETNNAGEMANQFFTARRILPNRALTLLDYRKLLIDLAGVKNAWLHAATVTYYADLIKGTLLKTDPGLPGIKPVPLQGLYDVIIEYRDDIALDADKSKVMNSVTERLQANRNLCEDFVSFSEVGTQNFLLCCELELAPEADAGRVKAEILFQVQQYLAPSPANYTLSEMLERKKGDGTSFTVDEIFDGPMLDCGFFDNDELARSDLRTKIYLSDVISIIMDLEGVQAVKDIVINPEGTSIPLADKWVVPVEARKKALLNQSRSRLVFYKRNMPVTADPAKAAPYYAELENQARAKAEQVTLDDLEIPLGTYRQPASYYSFQNHFPGLYGLSDYGLNSAADDTQRALTYQLKAYLLFFDQVMANYFAQLGHVKELLSTNPDLQHTYFCQLVDSFADYNKIYAADPLPALEGIIEDKATFEKRRNRFLDHLSARFAERFTDFAHIAYASFGATPQEMINIKCEFLSDYPALSSERSLAYNYTQKTDGELWNTENVSGLERRLAKLLGIRNATRRNLSDSDEGMYLIETILLRPEQETDPFLPICPDPNCPDCAEEDPYSYRIHVILPAASGRFRNMEFRRFVETVIREEIPAHILPRICWIAKNDSALLSTADLLDLNRLLTKLGSNSPDPVSAHLWSQVAPAIQTQLLDSSISLDSRKATLVRALNTILQGGAIYDAARFSGVTLSAETVALQAQNPTGGELVWLNRMLLSDAYPEEIAKGSKEDMAVLEKAYRDWLYLKAGAETGDRTAKLKAFRDILFAVRNVYPPQKLHECDSGEDQPKFLLGQTALGTMKDEV